MKFLIQPYEHQKRAVNQCLDSGHTGYAYLMEQGTGKTLTVLRDAVYLYNDGLISALLIICPKSIINNWVQREIPKCLPKKDYVTARLAAQITKKETNILKYVLTTKDPGLKILLANYEITWRDRFQKTLAYFLEKHKTMMILDESSHVKNIKSRQTKACIALGRMAKHRRILTGTPVTHSPLDVFSQFEFLKSRCLGFSSFWAFRSMYAKIERMNMGTTSFDKVIGYHNLKDLSERVAIYSFRVTKKECLDLPDKIYQTREVPLTTEQKKLYRELTDQALHVLEDSGEVISVTSVIALLNKLSQVTSGFIKDDEGTIHELKSNRINVLMEILQETGSKAIIWCGFRHNVKMVQEALSKTFGPSSVVTFDGSTSNKQREVAIDSFQNDPEVRFFAATSAASKGLTLHASDLSIYFANTTNLGDRLQSEDRNHRIGQRNAVTYIDLVAPDTTDVTTLGNLRNKVELADLTLAQLKKYVKGQI